MKPFGFERRKFGTRKIKVKDPLTGRITPGIEYYKKDIVPITDVNEAIKKIQQSTDINEIKRIKDLYFLSEPKLREGSLGRFLFVVNQRFEFLLCQNMHYCPEHVWMNCRINDVIVHLYRPDSQDSVSVWTKKESSSEQESFKYKGEVSLQDLVLMGIEHVLELID